MKQPFYYRFLFIFLFVCGSVIAADEIGDTELAEVVAVDSTPAEEVIEPFGSNLFKGNFLRSRGDGLNPEYVMASGDRVSVSVWGALTQSEIYTIDSQGNIFIPDLGPLKLAGVRSSELTRVVKSHFKKVYTGNFDVYTNLVTAQPVSIFVTGMVNNPGKYSGFPSDSVLYFIDLAGGIDEALGGYRKIDLIRKGQSIAEIDLYEFLLNGELVTPQLLENDTILVNRKNSVVTIEGDVARSSTIEMKKEQISGDQLLQLVPVDSTATEMTVYGVRKGKSFVNTFSYSSFLNFILKNGDRVEISTNQQTEQMLIHLEGIFDGASTISVNRNAKLLDVLNHIKVNRDLANINAIHLRRVSVAKSQKDTINDSLFRLERSALLAMSGSSGEAGIRTKEAELMSKFAEKAKLIDPLGRVVTVQNNIQQNIFLEPDDTIVIPNNTEVVKIAGEVMMVHAMTFREGWSIKDYIEKVGGFTERANAERIIIHHANAEVTITDYSAQVKPGDEIIVPPKIDFKTRQFALDLVDLIYKIAVSANVALSL